MYEKSEKEPGTNACECT